ncbi:zinc finger and SCAN domain-containing protein 10-like [Haliotis rubra]|uniref:zinc finger and SCAN domain-containing protein 10-like n=1 Tax=Haliotis rubra TaxID=36100 RepID=UPI001EE53021|nr:zinc finger and SCAN domain-containing protein 10-like [Haliotis rubra]
MDKTNGANVAMDTISGASVAIDTIKGASVAMGNINGATDTPAKMSTQASPTSKLQDFSETMTSSMLLNTDGDLTAVEALMQMKSPQHAGIRPHLVGPAGDRMTCPSVLQKAVSVPVLKCTPDGRVIKTPAGAPAVFKSVKLSPTLPPSPGKDLQSELEIASTSADVPHEDDVDDDDDNDDGISNDDEIIEEPVRKKRKTKKDLDWTPAKPVRKSLRNSYEGVSKIVASLLRQKKPRGTVKKMKAKADVAAAGDAAEGVEENGEPDREFVKCNICRSLQPWEELRQHIDTEHGINAYQCGLCSKGFDSNVDLHMHLLGHEKDDRIKRTLSLLTGDTEVRRQLASTGVSSGLSGEASAAILALERGGDLKEVLATVEVDVEDLINTDIDTSNKEEETNKEDIVNIDTKTSTKDGKTIVTMSNVKSSVEHGDSGSSQNQTSVETSSKRNQEDINVDSSKSTKPPPDGDSCIENPTSTETTSGANECSDDVKQPGDCAACRESFMSSFSLKKQNSELPMMEHTCDRAASEECWDRESGDEGREGLTCVCGLCGYKFVNVNLLTRHVKAHYREKPFSCDMCSKKYARRDELVKHRMSHQAVVVNKPKQERRKFLPRTKSGKYPCHLCKEQFKTYQSRYTHVLCHESDEATSEKVDIDKPRDKSSLFKPTDKSNVTCDVCGLVLSGPRHLVRHKLIHTNERPWLCQECGKSFLRSDDLRVHQRRQHSNVGNSDANKESKFRKVCPFCKRVFTSFNSFRNHVKTHKSERLDGSLCA